MRRVHRRRKFHSDHRIAELSPKISSESQLYLDVAFTFRKVHQIPDSFHFHWISSFLLVRRSGDLLRWGILTVLKMSRCLRCNQWIDCSGENEERIGRFCGHHLIPSRSIVVAHSDVARVKFSTDGDTNSLGFSMNVMTSWYINNSQRSPGYSWFADLLFFTSLDSMRQNLIYCKWYCDVPRISWALLEQRELHFVHHRSTWKRHRADLQFHGYRWHHASLHRRLFGGIFQNLFYFIRKL